MFAQAKEKTHKKPKKSPQRTARCFKLTSPQENIVEQNNAVRLLSQRYFDRNDFENKVPARRRHRSVRRVFPDARVPSVSISLVARRNRRKSWDLSRFASIKKPNPRARLFSSEGRHAPESFVDQRFLATKSQLMSLSQKASKNAGRALRWSM